MKQAVYDYLKDKNIWHEITEHEAVFNMAEVSSVTLPYPEADAKNLFLRNDKHEGFCLVTVRGDKRVDTKALRRNEGLRPLSFGSPEELMQKFKVAPGSVSPFGLLNDKDCSVKFYLDEDFFTSPYLIGIHPNDNTATVWLKAEDLVLIIKDTGHEVKIIKIPERERA